MAADEDFLKRFDVNVWQRGDERAPHKPLLLLLALARLQRGDDRLMLFEDVDTKLAALLRDFGPARKTTHPELPFWYLQTDGIWELPEREELKAAVSHRKKTKDIPRAVMKEHHARGGFTPDIDVVLRHNRELLHVLVTRILDAHFPHSIHDDLLAAVGFAWEAVPIGRRRDPAFRDSILRVYEHRCAVCGYDGRLGNTDLGLEAAHVRWHTHGGPDDVSNGLALCVFHHRALDRGAIGLDGSHRVLVSQDVHGQTGVEELLLRFHGASLRLPQQGFGRPEQRHIDWHRAEVFRGEPRIHVAAT